MTGQLIRSSLAGGDKFLPLASAGGVAQLHAQLPEERPMRVVSISLWLAGVVMTVLCAVLAIQISWLWYLARLDGIVAPMAGLRESCATLLGMILSPFRNRQLASTGSLADCACRQFYEIERLGDKGD